MPLRPVVAEAIAVTVWVTRKSAKITCATLAITKHPLQSILLDGVDIETAGSGSPVVQQS